MRIDERVTRMRFEVYSNDSMEPIAKFKYRCDAESYVKQQWRRSLVVRERWTGDGGRGRWPNKAA